jgi:hypothetical protein
VSAVPPLLVQFAPHADGGVVLRCVRADGSATWQRHAGAHARFFALHDLTHFAVESTLGVSRGFFGLVASGWSIEDTGGKGAPGPLPAEALLVEHLVGFLDAERAGGVPWSAADFAPQAASVAPEHPLVAGGAITDALLDRVRARRDELFARWGGVPPGAVLELSFGGAGPGA